MNLYRHLSSLLIFCVGVSCLTAGHAALAANPGATVASKPLSPRLTALGDFETSDSLLQIKPYTDEDHRAARAAAGNQGKTSLALDQAHTGKHSCRIDYELEPKSEGLALKPIRILPTDEAEKFWGLEFWLKADAPHDANLTVTMTETNGQVWQFNIPALWNRSAMNWSHVALNLDLLQLIPWTRVDGKLERTRIETFSLSIHAFSQAKAKQKGSLWIDSLRPLDGRFPVGTEARDGFTMLKLDQVVNSDAVAFRGNPSDGDFHAGEWELRTLPGEFFPKGPVETFQGVPFVMPDVRDGKDNHIRCNLQELEGFPEANYSALYFLVSGKFGDQMGDVTLTYSDGSSAKALLEVSDWSVGPTRGDVAAIHFPCAYKEQSVEVRQPKIYLQSVRVDPKRKLARVTLPLCDYLKVFGLTLCGRTDAPAVGLMQARALSEVFPHFAMRPLSELKFDRQAQGAGVYGGYMERRNTMQSPNIPLSNGTLTFNSECKKLPEHVIQWPNLGKDDRPLAIGGIQGDGEPFGAIKSELLDWTCLVTSCTIADAARHQFKVYQSRTSPAVLYETDLDSVRWHEPELGGPTRLAYMGEGGIRTEAVQNGLRVPVPAEPWLLLWHEGRTELGFDVPVLIVMEKKPTGIRALSRGKGLDLRFDYSGPAGRLLAMPLLGIGRLPLEQSAAWGKALPEEIVGRCREWAARLQAFPVGVKETSRIDEAQGITEIQNEFKFLELKSDWPIKAQPFAPLPPVAALARDHGYPVEALGQLKDLNLDTLWGPLRAVEGTSITWRIPLPRGINNVPVPVRVSGDPFLERLQGELTRHILKENVSGNINSSNSGDAALVRILAPSALMLGDQPKVRDYCRAVARNITDDKNLKVEKELLSGEFFLMDDRFWCKNDAYDKEWAIGIMLAGLWSYSHYLDDTALLRERWDRIRGLYHYYQIVFDWATGSTFTMVTGIGGNSDGIRFAWEGMLAMTRMACAVGDAEVYNDAATRSSKQMMSLYATWFAPEWAAKHDYVVEFSRHIPADKAELRFPPNGWSESVGCTTSWAAEFFQCTHAIYNYNLDEMVFLHDSGLDGRMRKWIFEAMPQIHPNWADGNAWCEPSHSYYGSAHSMAHLVVRSIMFHQNPQEVYALYEKCASGTRVLKEWYTPMGAKTDAFSAMVIGSAPVVLAPVDGFKVLKNVYEAQAGRQTVVLQGKDGKKGELRVRCWGAEPRRVTVDGQAQPVRYDKKLDYLVLPVAAQGEKTVTIEIGYR